MIDVSPPPEPRPAAKLLGTWRVKLRIALASAAVLLVGALLAPRAAPTVISTPEERPAPLISEQVQQREIVQPFRGVRDVATRVRAHSVAIPRPREGSAVPVWDYAQPPAALPLPAGFGVAATAQGDILTHAAALAGRSAVTVQTAGGAQVEAALVAYEPDTGLALLRTATGASIPAAPLLTGRAEPGTLVAAAAFADGVGIALPAFVTRTGPEAYQIGVAEGAMAPGAPLYDMDGLLVAVAGRGGTAFPAQEAVARLTGRLASGEGRESSVGVAVQPLTDRLAALFDGSGVLVSDVVGGGPADAGGVRAGDLLMAVGETSVDSVEAARDAIAQLAEASETTLQLLRGSRSQAVVVTVATAFDVAAMADATEPADTAASLEAGLLFTPEQLRAAGVPRSARVLRVGGRDVSSPAQLARVPARDGYRLVYLMHEGRRFFAAVPDRP